MLELGKNPALIVIDMQNAFCKPEGSMNQVGLGYENAAAVVEPVARLLNAARGAGIPIFQTRYTLNADYSDAGLLNERYPGMKDTGAMVRDTWDNAIIDELEPREGEHVVDKTRYSAFIGTDLEERLRELGVDTLIVCGVTTEVCVESTIRDAFQRDIRIFVPGDATAAIDTQRHEDALRVIEYALGTVTAVDELEQALAALPQPAVRS
jgi:ureidoacrylate peracid hydrolase